MPRYGWDELNARLMATGSETELLCMLEEELARRPVRRVFVRRIHSRYSRVRSQREARELEGRMG